MKKNSEVKAVFDMINGYQITIDPYQSIERYGFKKDMLDQMFLSQIRIEGNTDTERKRTLVHHVREKILISIESSETQEKLERLKGELRR